MQGPGLFGEQHHGGLFGERSPKKPEEENGEKLSIISHVLKFSVSCCLFFKQNF